MKTIIIFLLATLIGYSQVGIGTNDPKATLHIANNDTLTHSLQMDKVPLSTSRYFLVIEADGKIGKRLIPFPGHLREIDTITEPKEIKPE